MLLNHVSYHLRNNPNWFTSTEWELIAHRVLSVPTVSLTGAHPPFTTVVAQR